MISQEVEAALMAFDRCLAQEITGDQPWRALQALTERLIGAKLFTIMTVDMENGVTRRAYSSDPVTYPVSGVKPIVSNACFETLQVARKPFVANKIADIAAVFPDHETIWSLGCGSVINFPVILGDTLTATLNMLHEEDYYTPQRVAATAHLSLPGKAACLIYKLGSPRPEDRKAA